MSKAKQLLQDIDTYAQHIGDTLRDPLMVLDRNLRVKSANRAYYETFQTRPEETEGRLLYTIGGGEWNITSLLSLLKDVVPTKTGFDDYEVSTVFPGVGQRTMLLHARKLYRPGNRTTLVVLVMEDVTMQRKLDAALLSAFEREHRIAASLQRSQLFVPPEDAFPGLSVEILYETASYEALVGGDFWDTFVMDDGKVAFTIGDVMGKGLTAARFTSEVKYSLRAFLREHSEPDTVMKQLNTYMLETSRLYSGGTGPICLQIAIVDGKSGDGVVCTASMEPPMIARADGTVDQIDSGGVALAIYKKATYETTAFKLHRGDILVMCTDGITEARRGKAFLGTEGLIRLAGESSRLGVLALTGQAILNGAREFAGGKLQDDACLLLARLRDD